MEVPGFWHFIVCWRAFSFGGRSKTRADRRKAPLPCATTVIVNVAQQGVKNKSVASHRGGGPPRQVFVVLILLCSLTFFICCLKTRFHNTGRSHRTRSHSSSTDGRRYIIFTTLHCAPRHYPDTRFSLSTLELLPRLPFPVPTEMWCGDHTGSPAHRVVRSHFDLLSIGCRTQRQTRPQAWLSPSLPPHSLVSRSAAPSNDASTTNSQEEAHPVLPQLVSFRRSCPICCAELAEHKHRGAQLHNTGVHATFAAEPEACAIHKAKTFKRCWSQRVERTKYWLA